MNDTVLHINTNRASQLSDWERQKEIEKARNRMFWSRYRTIIVAVACFLVFDLGVLILNFYTSFQINDDAIGINLSGRQRMLSQRTAKSLMVVADLRRENPDSAELAAARKELTEAVTLFDATLSAFQNGDTVIGGAGSPVFLKAASGQNSHPILQQAQDIWQPYFRLLQPVIAGKETSEELEVALEYALDNNLKLLGLMNDLTSDLEHVAETRASRLRMVQTTGIFLALMNFVFILYKFIHQLRNADIAVDEANEENRAILSSVREGLFLITDEYKLGSQISATSHEMFGKPLAPGDNFFDLLGERVSAKAGTDAREYIELLFAPRIKERLVKSINPLSEVEIQTVNKFNNPEQRYLSFNFNRVKDKDGVIRHLLVTAQDITQRVNLEKQLGEERTRSQQEFSMLLKAVSTGPNELRQFVDSANDNLMGINELLQDTAHSHDTRETSRAITDACRRVHAFKGDASALGLDTLADMAHNFETDLFKIRDAGENGSQVGDALLALPVVLNNLLDKVNGLKGLVSDIPPPPETVGHQPPSTTFISQLAQTIAKETEKEIETHTDIAAIEQLTHQTGVLVREIITQLVRNAIVHGIESPQERTAAGKSSCGHINIWLGRDKKGWILHVRDDGGGVLVEKVRDKLLRLGWYTEQELAGMNDRQVVEHIFQSGFSTATLSTHAGRGVGLDVVLENTRKLNRTHFNFSSQRGEYTQFSIYFTG